MKRYLYLTLLVSLSCLFTLSVCGCDEESKGLSVEFKVGEKFSRKIHADSDLKMMFPNADKKTADMVLDFHVKSVDPEGVSTIEVTIGSLKASVSTLGQVYIFDSEDPAASEKGTPGKVSQTKRFLDAFKGLKGEKYSAQVDATGKVTKLFEMSPRIKSVAYSSTHGDILGSDQVKMLLTESYLKEYVSPLFYSDLTRADITPELTWKGGGCVLVPDVPLVALQKSYQIKDVELIKGSDPVTVSFTSKMPASEQDSNQKADNSDTKTPQEQTRFEALGAEGKGTVTFIPKGGKLVKVAEFVSVSVKSKSIATPRPGSKKGAIPKMLYYINRTIEAI